MYEEGWRAPESSISVVGQLTNEGKIIIPLSSLPLSLTKDSEVRELSLQEKKALYYANGRGFIEVKLEGDNLELEFDSIPPHRIYVQLYEDSTIFCILNCSEPTSPLSLFDTTVQFQIEVTAGNN